MEKYFLLFFSLVRFFSPPHAGRSTSGRVFFEEEKRKKKDAKGRRAEEEEEKREKKEGRSLGAGCVSRKLPSFARSFFHLSFLSFCEGAAAYGERVFTDFFFCERRAESSSLYSAPAGSFLLGGGGHFEGISRERKKKKEKKRGTRSIDLSEALLEACGRGL